MSQLREYIQNHRNELLPKVQAIYEKHGIEITGQSEQGATIRLTRGTSGLMDAMVEEAELLASLAQPNPGATVTEPEDDDEIETVFAPPTPPGGEGTGKWVGKWVRTFTGTYTEEVETE